MPEDEETHERRLDVARRAWAALRRRRLGLLSLVGLTAVLLIATLAASLQGGLVAGLIHSTATAPDANRDGLSDVASNTLGVDPHALVETEVLPAGWVERYHLDLADAALPDRTAPYPVPPSSPEVYGSGGLPPEFRMTYREVYSHGRPADWNESRDGVWDSRLDPTRTDVNGSRVPYSWIIHFGLDPFDAGILERVAPGSNVTWTPRQAYERGLSPTSADADNDWLPDETELRMGLDPRAYSTIHADIADGWLVARGLDATDPAIAFQDLGHSGLTVQETFNASLHLHPAETAAGKGLDPRKTSTTGGPIPDGWLVKHGLDPLDPSVPALITQRETITDASGTHDHTLSVLDAYLVNRPPDWDESTRGPWWGGVDPRDNDTDQDGLTNIEEIVGWDETIGGHTKHVDSDPTRTDSDGDGLPDAAERRGKLGAVAFSPTDPGDPDTDGDGLTDGQELALVAFDGHTLPRTDPTSPDTSHQGLQDGEAAAYWVTRYEACLERAPYAWGPFPRSTVVKALFGNDEAASCARLLPEGDARASGTPNLLNADVDGDQLMNGWEVHPDRYRESVYGPKPGEPARPETDPANPDTDADGLPDGWELKMGIPTPSGATWNLDPSKWSSFGDDISDGDRDLLKDTVTWNAYRSDAGGTRATTNTFVATNKIKFRYGANPNRLSSSADGIPDAWKIFWGDIYPSLLPEERGDIYPGMPGPFQIPSDLSAPRIGRVDDAVIDRLTWSRFLLNDEANGTLAACRTNTQRFRDSQGASIEVCHEQRAIVYDQRAAAQNGTNPYLRDTDGDGLSDAWEATWRVAVPGAKGLDPARADAAADADGDAFTNLQEYLAGTSPFDSDSDLGGADDGIESELGLRPLDPADDTRALDQALDSDGDGLANLAEIKGYLGGSGRIVKTDPLDVDTDHDGLLDGPSLHTLLHRTLSPTNDSDRALIASFEDRGFAAQTLPNGSLTVMGENDTQTDPTVASTDGSGAPDGWFAVNGTHNDSREETAARYSYGRPAWWNESLDGMWRWGLLKDDEATPDHDGDGLRDDNGEDPIPYANARNVLPRGDPLEPGITPAERLYRSQGYGDGWRRLIDGTTPPPMPEAFPEANLTFDPLPLVLVANGSQHFTGRLMAGNSSINATYPVPNATVVLSVRDERNALGVAITREDGRFDGVILAADTIPPPPGAEGVPVFGSLDGKHSHVNDPARLAAVDASRELPLIAWSYAQPFLPTIPRLNHTYLLANDTLALGLRGNHTAAWQNVSLILPTTFTTDLTETGRAGGSVDFNVTLKDAFGRAVAQVPITLSNGAPAETNEDGVATLRLSLPATPGVLELNVSYAGSPSLVPTWRVFSIHVTEPTKLIAFPPLGALAPGSEISLSGRLLTASGAGIPDAPVRVTAGATTLTATSGENGAFDLPLSIPSEADVGAWPVHLHYDGNDSYDAADADVAIPLVGQPRWTTGASATNAGQPAAIVARLDDEKGEPIPEADFSILDANGKVLAHGRTAAGGLASVALSFQDQDVGERVVLLHYEDERHGEATAPVTVLVSTPTTITLDAPDLVRGRDGVIGGRLATPTGAPVARQPIVVSLANLTTRVVTRADGGFNATFDVDPLSTGQVRVVAVFEGTPDGVYHASRASLDAALRNAPRVTIARATVLTQAPKVQGLVETLRHEPIPALEVTLSGPDGNTSALTDNTGRFTIPVRLARAQPLGPFAASLATAAKPDLAPARVDLALTLRDAGALSIDLPAVAASPSTLARTFHVLDSAGRDVADATLRASLDGVPVATSATGGILTIKIPQGIAPGEHRVEIGVASGVVDAPNLTRALSIQRETRLVLAAPAQVQSGSANGVVTVKLVSADGPVPNATIRVVGAAPHPMDVRTDASGATHIPLSPLASPSSLSLAFAGNGTEAATTLGVQVRVVAAPSPAASLLWLGILALVVLALLVALAYFMRRLRGAGHVETALRRASRKLREGGIDLRVLYSVYLALLDAAKLTEDEVEQLTFGELLARFVSDPRALMHERRVLEDAFTRTVYAHGELEAGAIEGAAAALDALAGHIASQGPTPGAKPPANTVS